VSSSVASTERLLALESRCLTPRCRQPVGSTSTALTKLMDKVLWSRAGERRFTREKIVAGPSQPALSVSQMSPNWVRTLGKYPLPVESSPWRRDAITQQFATMGGQAEVRLLEGKPLITDNGQILLDVTGLEIGRSTGLRDPGEPRGQAW